MLCHRTKYLRWASRQLALWLIACLGLAYPAAAAPAHGVQLGVDLAFYSVRDDTLAPIAFSGPRFGVEPRYFGSLGSALISAGGRFGLGYVIDRAGARGASGSWGLHLAYLPLVSEGSWNVAVGPALGWDNARFWFAEWDDAHTYWIGTLWLGPGVRAWHWLSARWRVDLAAELALLGWQSRTPDGRRRKQETSDFSSLIVPATRDMRFGWLADWQVVRCSLELYRVRTAAPTPNGFGIGVELGLTRAAEPSLAFAFNTSLRASYTWSL